MIQATQGLALLGRLLGRDAAQVGVVPVNWTRLLQQVTASPFLLGFQTSPRPRERSPFIEQLEAAAANERHALLEAHVRWQLSQVLGWSSAERISRRAKIMARQADRFRRP